MPAPVTPTFARFALTLLAKVCGSEILCSRRVCGSPLQTSAVALPASCSRRIAIICSSVNLLLRIVRLLPGGYGLYPILEELAGLRSSGLPTASMHG